MRTSYRRRFSGRLAAYVLPLCGLICVLSAAVASAVTYNYDVGVSFIGRTDRGTPNNSLGASQVAGVVPQSNWNNGFAGVPSDGSGGSTTSGALNDNTGAATAITLTANQNDSWYSGSGNGATPTADQILMNGILKNQGGGASTKTMVFNNVPTGFNYDIIVYCAENGGGSYGNLNVGSQTYYLTEPDGGSINGSGGFTYTRATATTDAGSSNPGANYVMFSNIAPTGNSITINVNHQGGSDGFGVAGIQLLQINPNPPLTWTGGGGSAGNGSWDTTASTANWKTTTGGTPAPFVTATEVTFDDTGANRNIAVQGGGVTPSKINFTNSASPYTFSGGSIGGAGIVSISGGGSVTFNAANSYTGPTNVTNGTLRVGHSNAVQNSTVTVSSVNGLTFSSGLGTANLGALAGSTGIALTDAGSAAVTLSVGANNANTTYSGNLSGAGGLTKTGSGTLTLSGVNSYNGATNITGGTLRLISGVPGLYEGRLNGNFDTTDANPKTSVQLTTRYANIPDNSNNNAYPATGGAWHDDTTFAYTGYITNASGVTKTYQFNEHFDDNVYLNIDGQTILNNTQWDVQTSGTISLTPGVHTFDLRLGEGGGGVGPSNVNGSNGAGNTGLGVAFSTDGGATFSPLTDTGNGLLLSTGSIQALPTGTAVSMSNSSTLDIGSAAVTIGSLQDSGSGNQVLLSGGTLTTGSAGSTSFAGAFHGTGGLTKVGSGTTFTISGVSDYTGATTVSAGTLRIASSGQLGNTAISVASGATLQARPNTGSTIANGATSSLSVAGGGLFDMSGDGAAGTFRVGTLSLGNGSTLNFDVGTSGLNTVVDTLAATGAASDTGTTTINIVGFGSNNLSNGLYPIITAASGLTSGTFTLANSTVTVNSIAYQLALVPSGTQEFLRITAPALNGSWIQTGTTPPSYNWGDGSNWASGQIPNLPGDTATFAVALTGNQTVNINTTPSVGVVTLNSTGGNFTFSGNALTLNAAGAGALFTNSQGLNTISSNVVLSDTGATIVNAASGTSLTVAGVVSGSSPLAINTGASGTVVFNGTNTFTGGLTVAGGTLQVPTINNVATDGPLGHNSSVTLGAVGGGVGTIEYTGVGSLTSSMPLAVATGGGGLVRVDDSGSAVTLSGNITGSGSFAATGPGTVILTASGNNFSGGLNVSGGTLRDSNAATGTLGSGLVTVSGGTVDLNGNSINVSGLSGSGTSGVITNGGGATSNITLTGAGTNTYNGAINAGAHDIALAITNGGTQVLGGTSTFGGGIAVQNGTLRVTSNGGIGSTNAVTLGSGGNSGLLVLGSGGTGVNVSVASVGASGNGSSNRVVGGATANSNITIATPSDLNITAPLFGGSGTNQNNLSVTFNGTGNVTISASQPLTGGITSTGGGQLTIPFDPTQTRTPVGSGPITLSGATLNLQGVNGATGSLVKLRDNGADPDNSHYNTLSALNTFWNGVSANVTVNSKQGGKTNLDYSNNGYGNGAPFNSAGATTAAYGFAPADHIEMRLDGYINITTEGDYAFSSTSDDGSMVFLKNNDTPVVNNNNFQGATKKSGTVHLTPGLNPITLAFYEGGGGAGVLFQYDGPDTNVSSPTEGNTTINQNILFLNSNDPLVAATQSYGNTLRVTADSSVNITNSLNAVVGPLQLGAANLSVVSTDNTANPFSLTTGATTLTGNGAITVGSSSGGGPGTVTLGAVGDGGNNYSLTKYGSGTLVLNSPGTYGGGTVISAGVVQATTPGALGTGAVTINDSTTLQLVTNPSPITLNGGSGWHNATGGNFQPQFNGNTVTMTDNNNSENSGTYFGTPQAVQAGSFGFTASFTYQVINPSPGQADGMAFVLQNQNINAVGGGGSGLGYEGITSSAAFGINIYNGHNAIGTNFFTGGNLNGYNYNATGSINFLSGDPIKVTLTYDPVAQTVLESDVDLTTNSTYIHTFTGVNLASILGSSSALVGFTGGTGGANAKQQISNFAYYTPGGASSYTNTVIVPGNANSQIDIVPTTFQNTTSMGTLNVGSGGTASLNVTANSAPDNTAFGLGFSSVSLNSNLVLNVASNGPTAPGTVTVGPITDNGGNHSITMNGPGVLKSTSPAGTFTGGTIVNGGTVSVANNTSLGTGQITLAGGKLQLAGTSAAPTIAINFEGGTAGGAPTSLGPTESAGVVAVTHWNNAPNNAGSTASVDSPISGVIVDGAGNSTSVSIVYNSNNTYGVGQANATGDQKMMNGYLDLNQGANTTTSVALSNIPFASYKVYAYVGSDGNGRTGHGTINGQTYYFVTSDNPFGGYVLATGSNVGNANNANYLEFDGVTGSSFTYNMNGDTSNVGLHGIEIVSDQPAAVTLANSVLVTADSSIDVTGANSGGIGNLSIGANTLSVTGGSTGANAPYLLSTGTVTLTGNATFDVANNGSGAGVVTLGAVSGSGFGITKTNAGVLALTAAANTYSGATNVSAGTLALVNNTTNNNIGSSPTVTVAGGATLDVTGLASGTFRVANGQTLTGAGTVHGSVIVGDGSVPMGGAATIASGSGNQLTIDGASGLTLSTNSIASFALSGTPGGQGVNPMIVISGGNLSLATSSTVQLTGTPMIGTYDLFSFSGTGPSSGLSISNLTGNNSYQYSLTYLANEIDLVISNAAVSAVWNSNGDGNFSESAKWNPVGVPSNPTLTATFGNGASDQITGSPNAIHVTIDQAVTDGHLVFNNSHGVTYSLDSDGTHSISLNNSGATATIDASANANINANLVLADSQGTTITVATGKTLTISGGIGGSGGTNGLVKAGLGTLTLDNAGSYSGATTVNAGTLRTTMSGSIGSGGLVVNNSGSVAEFGNTQTVSSLSGNGGTVRVDGVSLTVNQAGNTSFGGGVTLDVGGSSLTKSGSGHLTIGGATDIKDNASITVSADMGGTNKLTLSGASTSIGTGVTATIGAGATLELAGTGSNLGTTTVVNNAHGAHVIDNGSLVASSTTAQIVGGIDGGDTSTPGAGSVTVNDGASLQVDHVLVDSITIGNTSAGGAILTLAASKADGTPAISLGGSGGGNSIGLSHLLATRSLLASSHSSLATGSSGGSGSVSSLSSGSLGSTAAVPEPSTVALLAIGALSGAGLGLRRRVRR